MVRCPVCRSARIVVVVAPGRRAFCTRCDARWVQDGSEQRDVHLPADRVTAAAPWRQRERFSVDWA